MNTSSASQIFTIDCSQWSGPPLIKTKFGVYQTPLIRLADLLKTASMLQEVNVQDLRYEIGWGKSDVLAWNQISGAAAKPTIDFSTLDAFTHVLASQKVKPLFALTYCPKPLQSRHEWAAWKDMPNDLVSWQKIVRAYSAHLRSTPGMAGSLYEVWNEPDMPDPDGKMFFTGTPKDYEKLYAATVPGVRQGDIDAPVGGAATAYDLRYLTAILAQPLDFASIHAYDNYAAQLGRLRDSLGQRPDLPLLLTEYASFTEFPSDGPQSRHIAAAHFFRDVKGMLTFTDLAKVYWAQWADAGQVPGMGLITWDGHRKAIFNAFKIYGMMPVDRNLVTPDGGEGVDILASSDDNNVGVACWNSNSSAHTVTLRLKNLAFHGGIVELYRIDNDHGSYVDNPAEEALRVCETRQFDRSSDVVWTGSIPAQGVVYLKVFDATHQSLLRHTSIGTNIRTHYWFNDRKSSTYSDFDPRTCIVRLGMGQEDLGLAQVGVVIDGPTHRFLVRVKKEGPFLSEDNNALCGIRIDFASQHGGYGKSILFHGDVFNARRTTALPWGKGAALADLCLLKSEVDTGKAFSIELAQLAPPDWDHKRILMSFILQNAGRGSKARIIMVGD